MELTPYGQQVLTSLYELSMCGIDSSETHLKSISEAGEQVDRTANNSLYQRKQYQQSAFDVRVSLFKVDPTAETSVSQWVDFTGYLPGKGKTTALEEEVDERPSQLNLFQNGRQLSPNNPLHPHHFSVGLRGSGGGMK